MTSALGRTGAPGESESEDGDLRLRELVDDGGGENASGGGSAETGNSKEGVGGVGGRRASGEEREDGGVGAVGLLRFTGRWADSSCLGAGADEEEEGESKRAANSLLATGSEKREKSKKDELSMSERSKSG